MVKKVCNTSYCNFYYCENINDSRKYIALINYFQDENDTIQPVTIYIELYSNLLPEGLGYTELLLDKENIISSDLSEYSYAKFQNGKLIYKFGNYQYSLKIENYNVDDSIPSYFSKNNFNHRYYKIYENTDLILSRETPDFLESIAPFSYLLIFYSLIVLVFLLLVYFPFRSFKVSLTFRNRLQFSIISIIFVSFLVIGTTTLLYLIKLNDDKNHDILSEKAHSVFVPGQLSKSGSGISPLSKRKREIEKCRPLCSITKSQKSWNAPIRFSWSWQSFFRYINR